MISGLFWLKKNDYYLWEMIYVRFENDFLLKKMISNEHKMITAEMISSRCCCKNSRLDLLLRKKSISNGNYYFRKWVEIIFFTEMLHNLRKI